MGGVTEDAIVLRSVPSSNIIFTCSCCAGVQALREGILVGVLGVGRWILLYGNFEVSRLRLTPELMNFCAPV
jgi:hypothetical protein